MSIKEKTSKFYGLDIEKFNFQSGLKNPQKAICFSINWAGFLQALAASEFPKLEHLELWLGTEYYGWSGKLDDVKPFLNPEKFPRLKYLGLRNSDISDEIAICIAKDDQILEQLEVLDLSLGTLGDKGASALLKSNRLTTLKELDLHHHFMTDSIIEQFKQIDLKVNIDEQNKDVKKYRYYEEDDDDEENKYEDRYVSVGE